LPKHLKAQINRELDRLELLLEQIAAVDSERNSLLAVREPLASEGTGAGNVAYLKRCRR
jgi:transposase